MRFLNRRGAILPLERVFAEHLHAVRERLDWAYRRALLRLEDSRTEPTFVIRRGAGPDEQADGIPPPATRFRNPLGW